MNRTFVVSLILCLSAPPYLRAEDSIWTLRQCIEHAVQNNITLKKNSQVIMSANEDLLQSRSKLLPSLSMASNHSLGYRPWTDSGMGTVANGMVTNSISKSYYNGSYGIDMAWTVWNGNQNRNNIKLSRLQVEQAEKDSATTANSIKEQIATLYVQMIYLDEAIKVSRKNLETSIKNEERGREMAKIGKMCEADLAQLAAQTAQDKYNIVDAEATFSEHRLQLKQLLEINEESSFNIRIPQIPDERLLAELPSPATVYETALTTRPEIASSRISIKSNEVSAKIAKAGMMPVIGLTGGVSTSTTSRNDKAWNSQIKTNLDTYVGVSLSIPIFDNRKTKTAVNKANIARTESILEFEDRKKQLYSAIEGHWLDAKLYRQKYEAAKASVSSGQKSYDLLSEQFRLGLKNIVELMTGKANLLTAQQNMLQSKYMALLSMNMLEFYRGGEIDL